MNASGATLQRDAQLEALTRFVLGLSTTLNAMEREMGFGPDYISFAFGAWSVSSMTTEEAADRLARSRWLTAFMVEGGSEGFFIHVGTVLRSEVPGVRLSTWGGLALVQHLGTLDEAHEMLKTINTFLMRWAG